MLLLATVALAQTSSDASVADVPVAADARPSMVTVVPSLLPPGVGGRYHHALGPKVAAFGGAGVAAGLGEWTGPFRGHVELGLDSYAHEVFRGPFARLALAGVGWAGSRSHDDVPPSGHAALKLLGGTRARLGETTSLGLSAGVALRVFDQPTTHWTHVATFGPQPGPLAQVQTMPTATLDIGFH